MALSTGQVKQLEIFFSRSRFSTNGAVITDLDGTAVHEVKGKIIIHEAVELGLKKIYDMGRPIVINTLRFPLSVIRSFAIDWYRISNAPIPVVLLNGSQLGYIIKSGNEYVFEQLVSFPLSIQEINDTIVEVESYLKDDLLNIILFYYPENWKNGEVIWTPDPQRIPHLQKKYPSASTVLSISISHLLKELLSNPTCMILLLADIPGDKLMAYQHTRRSSFITNQGVNKLFGAEKMAGLLDIELRDSIGAGDSDMDNFLKGVGLSVHVGNANLPYRGVVDTLRLDNYAGYGELLLRFAAMQHSVLK